MYNYLIDANWTPCDPNNNVLNSAVCLPNPTGKAVLEGIHLAYPVIQAKDTYWQDFGVMVAIALFYKILFFIGVYAKTSRTAKFHPNSDYQPAVPTKSAPKLIVEDGTEVTDKAKVKQPAVPARTVPKLKVEDDIEVTDAPIVTQPREHAIVAQPRDHAVVAQPMEHAIAAQPQDHAIAAQPRDHVYVEL